MKKETKTVENTLVNIPTNTMVSQYNETEEAVVRVSQNIRGSFRLDEFAARQFLAGARLFTNEPETVNTDVMLLSLDIAEHLYDIREYDDAQITLNREQVKTLKMWLEIRMAHCERERDERITRNDGYVPVEHNDMKFNPDTYIGQKHLLLDIREWLIGEIIED